MLSRIYFVSFSVLIFDEPSIYEESIALIAVVSPENCAVYSTPFITFLR